MVLPLGAGARRQVRLWSLETHQGAVRQVGPSPALSAPRRLKEDPDCKEAWAAVEAMALVAADSYDLFLRALCYNRARQRRRLMKWVLAGKEKRKAKGAECATCPERRKSKARH